MKIGTTRSLWRYDEISNAAQSAQTRPDPAVVLRLKGTMSWRRPTCLMDVAEAADVSGRSLQTGFRQFKNTTPAAYLRRIRLEAVHPELSRAENRLPIIEVALKWGFTQMGHFAARYRATFRGLSI